MPALKAESIGGANAGNIAAFLDTISVSEGTHDIGDDGYNVIVTSTRAHPILFNDYSNHPNISMAFNKIGDRSTAAGRYQVLYKYALAYIKQLKLPDFGKVSQDRIALQLMRETKADTLVRAGKFEEAVYAANSRWASFPGAGYGQHEHKIQTLLDAYLGFGGKIA